MTACRILDIGCGDGTLCRYFASPDRQVVGLDVDERHLVPDAGVSYVVGSADRQGQAGRELEAPKSTARQCLPGCTWEHLPLWRYRITWTSPDRGA